MHEDLQIAEGLAFGAHQRVAGVACLELSGLGQMGLVFFPGVGQVLLPEQPRKGQQYGVALKFLPAQQRQFLLI